MSMIARTLRSPRRLVLASFVLVTITGCHGLAKKHESNSIPQYGAVDPDQPGELRKVSQSSYIIEPPDELEITTQPSFPDLSTANFTVLADGNVDLGFVGDVYVSGLTLVEAEERIALQLNDVARTQATPPASLPRLGQGR
jgi:polysaccharide export outer membrane protein